MFSAKQKNVEDPPAPITFSFGEHRVAPLPQTRELVQSGCVASRIFNFTGKYTSG
jgi:hypothetical protein